MPSPSGTCPRCGDTAPPGHAFCIGCGADLRGQGPDGEPGAGRDGHGGPVSVAAATGELTGGPGGMGSRPGDGARDGTGDRTGDGAGREPDRPVEHTMDAEAPSSRDDTAAYETYGFDAVEPPGARPATEQPTERFGAAGAAGPATVDQAGFEHAGFETAGFGTAGYETAGYEPGFAAGGQQHVGPEYGGGPGFGGGPGYGGPGYADPEYGGPGYGGPDHGGPGGGGFPPSPPPRRRTPTWVFAVASALAVVVLAGLIGGGWLLLRPHDDDKSDPGASPKGSSGSGSASASPSAGPTVDAAVADRLRPSRPALAVVGCPRGASAAAVALDPTHLAVPAAAVGGASRVLVIGSGEPQPADVLGVDKDAGVAVLRAPDDVGKGAALAAADPAGGTQVVVVGADRRTDVRGPVTGGSGAARAPVDRRVVPGSPMATAGGQVAGMVAAAGGTFVPASGLRRALDRFRDADPVHLPSCADPAGPADATGLVASTPSVSGDARDVVDRLVAYYTAIDRHRFGEAYRMRSVRSGEAAFARGYRTTYDVGLRIDAPKVSGDRATTHLAFTSTQNAADAPAGTHQTCTRWEIDQRLDRRGGTWLVGPSSNPVHQGC